MRIYRQKTFIKYCIVIFIIRVDRFNYNEGAPTAGWQIKKTLSFHTKSEFLYCSVGNIDNLAWNKTRTTEEVKRWLITPEAHSKSIPVVCGGWVALQQPPPPKLFGFPANQHSAIAHNSYEQILTHSAPKVRDIAYDPTLGWYGKF